VRGAFLPLQHRVGEFAVLARGRVIELHLSTAKSEYQTCLQHVNKKLGAFEQLKIPQ